MPGIALGTEHISLQKTVKFLLSWNLHSRGRKQIGKMNIGSAIEKNNEKMGREYWGRCNPK